MNEHHEPGTSNGNNDIYLQGGNKRKALSPDKTDFYDNCSALKKVKTKTDQSSAIENTQHGVDYQVEICTFLCMANADKIVGDTCWYKVTPEDKRYGLFDDIVFQFKHDCTEGTLRIQTKHLLPKDSEVARITKNDIFTKQSINSPFAVHRYFTSFYDMENQTSTRRPEPGEQNPETKNLKPVSPVRLIICTNADMEDDLKLMWKRVEPLACKGDSPKLLDSYISSLFAEVGGICYQLDYSQLKQDGVDQLLKQCSKRTRLAKMLVKATRSEKNKITQHNPLIQEYAQAIANIIKWNKNSQHRFQNKFEGASSNDSTLEAFRNEFEVQYRQEYNKPSDFQIWKELSKKRVYVSESLNHHQKPEREPSPSTAIHPKSPFPDDKIYEVNIKSFCEQFRLICQTRDSHDLNKKITERCRAWSKKNSDDNTPHNYISSYLSHNITSIIRTYVTKKNKDTKCFKSDNVISHLWRLTYEMDPRQLDESSKSMSKFRIKEDSLKRFENENSKTQNKYNEVAIYDTQFGTTVLRDIMNALKTKPTDSYIFNATEFYTTFPKHIALRYYNINSCLFITCKTSHQQYKNFEKNVQELKAKFPENVTKIFFLKQCDKSELLFSMNDLSDSSEEQIYEKNHFVPLCGTYIALNILKDDFSQHYVEDVIKELDRGKKIEQNIAIVKKYDNIKSTYVQRFLKIATNEQMEQNNENRFQTEFHEIVTMLSTDTMDLTELNKKIKPHLMFNEILEDCSGKVTFTKQVSTQSDENQTKKVEILLDEEECGKSTHFTWLAWRLQEHCKSSWIVSCNFSDHIHFYNALNTENINQEIQDLRILYQLVRSLVHLEDRIQKIESSRALTCSKCISFSSKKLKLKTNLEKSLEENLEYTSFSKLKLEDKISLLVFQEKFNNGELKLLFDEFDRIESSFQCKVLKLLSRLAKLDGIKKMFLISHDSSKENIFEEEFNGPTFYQLQPLSLKDKISMLYKLLKKKFQNDSLDDEKKQNLTILLIVIIITTLGEQSNNPSNLVKLANTLGDDTHEYVDYTKHIIDLKCLKQLAVAIKEKLKCNK